MMRRVWWRVFLGCMGGLLIGASAQAEGIEIAPFYGLRFGGGLEGINGRDINLDATEAVGATVDFAIPSLQEKLEFLYSHQETDFSAPGLNSDVDVGVDMWQIGLLREFYPDTFRPFLAGTLGASHFTFSGPLEDKTLFSVGLGGGFKYVATEHVGFRLDMRGYVSFVEGGGAVACSGGCTVSYQGSVFLQGEVTPSIVIIF